MKVVFMGTPEFAVPCLNRLISDGHRVVLAVTQEDKPKGRKFTLTPPPVKQCALANGIEVFQPDTLKNNSQAWDRIAGYGADLFVVVAYGQILPPQVLAIPRYGCINVHASLLPKYRGAAPIQWAILNGETETGVTTMFMDKGLDTGDMLLKKRVPIPPEMTSGELYNILSGVGAEALSDTLKELEAGTLNARKQDDALKSYAPMLSRELSPIDWGRTAAEIHNQVRGLNPWPSALTTVGKRELKIHRSLPTSGRDGVQPGTVIDTSPLTIACGMGTALQLLEVQLEGSKRMDCHSFLLGHPIEKGRVLPD